MFIEPTLQIVSGAPEERNVCFCRRRHFAPAELLIISRSGSYRHCAALRLGQCLTSINTRRRASEYRLNTRQERKEMRRDGLIRNCNCGLTFAREPTLAHGQVAVHEVVAILLGVQILESQLVTHLM